MCCRSRDKDLDVVQFFSKAVKRSGSAVFGRSKYGYGSIRKIGSKQLIRCPSTSDKLKDAISKSVRESNHPKASLR